MQIPISDLQACIMLRLVLLSATAGLLTTEAAFSRQGYTVHIEQGELQGTFLASSNGRIFAAFQGIPYAQPPVGKLRFKEPVPPKPWTGVWNASLPGSMCLQYNRLVPLVDDEDPIIGEEDCLFINVYTPKVSTATSTPLLDVIVYIHGGAFMYGCSHLYGPKLLLDRDIVLVTFNYRLGPLGFLTTEDKVVPGNMGLKDQSAALRWIRKNIAAFGGNPDSVTLTGTSAGAVSVHYHYLSPLSRGLFKRGYSQSGSSLCPWAQMERGRDKAIMLAQALGCNTQDSQELVVCLNNRPARQIVQQVDNFQVWKYNPFTPFGPTVEVDASNPFLSKNPIDAILQGDVQDLPWMASVTTEEGLYPAADWIANENLMKVLQENFAEFIPHILDYNYTVPENKKLEVNNRIFQHYLQRKPLSMMAAHEITQIAGDRLFALETTRAAKLQAAINTAPVYFYQFAYRGKYSLSALMSGTTINLGVSHGDDLGYTVKWSGTDPDETQEDKKMSQFLIDIWSSYAHNSNPVPPDRNFVWEPTAPNSKELKYLHIGGPNKLEMRTSSNLGEQEFWDSLPINEPQVGKNTPLRNTHTEF